MTDAPRKVIALGSPTGEYRAAVESAVRSAGAELSITRESQKALAEIAEEPTLAVLVDMTALGAEHFCRKARANEHLRRVPIIGLSRNPGELSFSRVFAWGADDLVPIGAESSLRKRLQALCESTGVSEGGFGQAVVAESNAERCTTLGRVLTQAGYDVKYAIDAAAAEFYASQSETRVVVLNASLTPPRKLIEAVEQSGALPMWVVIGEPRNLGKLAQGLTGVDRVAVTSSSGSPEDVLFVANELVFSRASKRSEWRALYGTPVRFREAGADQGEFGFSYDVSASGIYVRSLLPFEADEIWLELRPPRRDKVVRLHGRIVRRFRFGSGSIASAPPGFGMRLEGPEDEDFRTWVAACQEFLGAPGPAPDATGAPVLGAKDASIRRPTPLGTARPIPADVRPKASGAPATVAPAATPPGDEIDEVLEMSERPAAPAEARAPMRSDVGAMLQETLSSSAVPHSGELPVTMTFDRTGVFEAATEDASPAPPPVPPRAQAAQKAEASSAKNPPPSSPKNAPPSAGRNAPPPSPKNAPPSSPKNAPPSARQNAPAAPPAVRESRSKTKLIGTPAMIAEAAPAAAPRHEPPRGATKTPVDAFAATMVSSGTPRAPEAATSATPAVTVVSAAPTPPVETAAPVVETTAPATLRAPSRPPPAAPETWAAIAPAAESVRPIRKRSGAIVLSAILGFAAVVGAVGAGFVLGLIPPGAASADRAPPSKPREKPAAEPTPRPAPEANPAPAASAPALAAPTESAPNATPPAASAAEAADSAAAAASAAPEPDASAEAPAPATPPGAPDVDLSKLAPTQGYLYVRSSRDVRVFVMGRDVGPVNEPILTGCGTRFVRLGRKLGDWTEPGGAVIIKCGVLTELKR